MTYKEKLLDPRWQKKRLEILNRDKWTCQNCFDKTSTLHVHHMAYPKGLEIWDVPNYMLVTLCEDCHSWVQTYNYWEDIIGIFKHTMLPGDLMMIAHAIEELLIKETLSKPQLSQVIIEVLTNKKTFNEVWEKRKRYLDKFNPDFDVKDYE